LDKIYSGSKKTDGEVYDVSSEIKEGQRKPFKACLDVGIVRTTTGARIFGALKGACDGGLHIPHSNKRFPGFKTEGDKETYNAKLHRERIFGGHVDKFMKTLKSDADAFKRQFSKWETALKNSKVDSLEKLYTKVHEEIRKNPAKPAKKEKKATAPKFLDKKKTIVEVGAGKKYKRDRRLTREERKKRSEDKIKKALK